MCSNTNTNLKRLITLQKRVFRIISKSSFDAHTNPICKNLKIIKFQIGKIMYLYKNGLPDSFDDMILLHSDVYSYNTRSKNSFRLSYCRTNVRKLSLKDLNCIILLTLKFRMLLVFLCLLLNLGFLF